MENKAADRGDDEEFERLLGLLRKVRALSTRESEAVLKLLAQCDAGTVALIRDAHFAEVDAIHAMGAAVDLMARRRGVVAHGQDLPGARFKEPG